MAEMSDDKKARLEAIRAANAAKKAADGDAPAAPAVAPATVAPAAPAAPAASAAPAAVGANMSDDKKARLEAIRAAKKAAGDAPAAAAPAVAAAPVATAPVATTAPAAAPKPAAPAKPTVQLTSGVEANSIIDLSFKGVLMRMIVGAIFCGIIGLGLATLTDHYITGGLFGAFIGVVGGYMVGDWPASKTTGD